MLAVGTGWNYIEYESLSAPFSDRGRRLDEQVDVLRRLWREPVVDYRGEFHRIDRAGILPRPARGTIPVWFGGGAKVALARAARTGDGFVFGSAGRALTAGQHGCTSCSPGTAGIRPPSRWTR